MSRSAKYKKRKTLNTELCSTLNDSLFVKFMYTKKTVKSSEYFFSPTTT